MRYLIRHWRGELPLGRSWANALVAGLLVLLLSGLVDQSVDQYSLYVSSLIGFTLIIVSLLYWVWAVVGIWQSAASHTQRDGQPSWGVISQIVLGAVLVILAPAMSTRIPPAIKEYALIISGHDPMGRVQLQLAGDGSLLMLTGGLGQGTARAVRAQLDAAPVVTTVMLDSHGGRLREAEQVADLIRERHLNTYVEGQCASACTYVFLAGKERAATPNAQIGFHRPTFPGFAAADEQRAMQDMRRVYQRAGISEHFMDRVAQTSPQDMWYPTHQELLDNAVINRTSLGGEFSTLALRTATSFQAIEHAIQQEPLFIALDNRFPGALAQVLAKTREAYDQALPDRDIWSASRAQVSDYLPELLQHATDELLESFLTLILAQLRALDGLGDDACSQYLQARLNADQTMPAEVLAQEAHWMMQALQTPVRTNAGISQQEMSAVMRQAMATMTEEDIALIGSFESGRDHSSAQCHAMIELYQGVQALPQQQRLIALRGMFQTAVQ